MSSKKSVKRRKKLPIFTEDYLLKKLPRHLYKREAAGIRDVLRQVAELNPDEKDSVKLSITRVRTMLSILNETEFVHVCDKLEENGWKPIPRESTR